MQISDNEIYLLIKYIKRVLWRVVKRLSYSEDAWCLEVKMQNLTVKSNPIPSNCDYDTVSHTSYNI